MCQNTVPDKYLSFPVESLTFYENSSYTVKVILPFVVKGNRFSHITLRYASSLTGNFSLAEGNSCFHKVFLPLQYDGKWWHLKSPDGNILFSPDIEIKESLSNGCEILRARFHFPNKENSFDFGFVYTKQQMEDYHLLYTPISLNRRNLAHMVSLLHYLVSKTAYGQKVLRLLWDEDVDIHKITKLLSFLVHNENGQDFLFTTLFLRDPQAHSLLLELQARLKKHQIKLFNGSLSYNEEYNLLSNLLTENTPIQKFAESNTIQPEDNTDCSLYTSGRGEIPYTFWA